MKSDHFQTVAFHLPDLLWVGQQFQDEAKLGSLAAPGDFLLKCSPLFDYQTA
jgi:hypothetical protein